MKLANKRPVAVEDLLQLKRAERSGEEFWTEFDRQLRTKQLSALVGKRPWWRDISISWMFSGLRRYHLPIGVTAVVAFTFSAYRSQTNEVTLEVRPVAAESSGRPQVMAEASASNPIEEVRVDLGSGRTEDAGKVVAVEASGLSLEPVGETVAPVGHLRTSPIVGMFAEEPLFASMVSASSSVESRLSVSGVSDPVMSNTLLSTQTRFEVRTSPARAAAVEPLHQITPPSERRGARILTAMVSMASVESAMRTTERAANRLSHEELYDQIQRFGARGAGVNLKF
jgi:hypothetical protein